MVAVAFLLSSICHSLVPGLRTLRNTFRLLPVCWSPGSFSRTAFVHDAYSDFILNGFGMV